MSFGGPAEAERLRLLLEPEPPDPEDEAILEALLLLGEAFSGE